MTTCAQFTFNTQCIYPTHQIREAAASKITWLRSLLFGKLDLVSKGFQLFDLIASDFISSDPIKVILAKITRIGTWPLAFLRRRRRLRLAFATLRISNLSRVDALASKSNRRLLRQRGYFSKKINESIREGNVIDVDHPEPKSLMCALTGRYSTMRPFDIKQCIPSSGKILDWFIDKLGL